MVCSDNRPVKNFTAVYYLIHLKKFSFSQSLFLCSFFIIFQNWDSNTQYFKAERPLGTRFQNKTGFKTVPSFISGCKTDIWWWLCVDLKLSFVEVKWQGDKSSRANFWLGLWLLTNQLVSIPSYLPNGKQDKHQDRNGALWLLAIRTLVETFHSGAIFPYTYQNVGWIYGLLFRSLQVDPVTGMDVVQKFLFTSCICALMILLRDVLWA